MSPHGGGTPWTHSPACTLLLLLPGSLHCWLARGMEQHPKLLSITGCLGQLWLLHRQLFQAAKSILVQGPVGVCLEQAKGNWRSQTGGEDGSRRKGGAGALS